MQAIVLAAGLGERLRDLTKEKPKALVDVSGKPLIEYVMEFLSRSEIKEVYVVVGYKGALIEEYLKNRNYNFSIKVMENNDYKKGNIISLLSALPKIDDSFILMNVDHIYYNPKIFDAANSDIRGITAICDFDRKLADDDMKVLIKNGKIVKISKKLKNYTGGYVGMTVVPKTHLDIYKNKANIVANKYGGYVNVEKILQDLADDGVPVYFKDISNLGWVEVDTIEDLKKAEEILNKIRRDRNTPRLNA